MKINQNTFSFKIARFGRFRRIDIIFVQVSVLGSVSRMRILVLVFIFGFQFLVSILVFSFSFSSHVIISCSLISSQVINHSTTALTECTRADSI